MAIDLAAQIEDELAAEITTHHHEQKAQTGRPLRAAREEWPPAQSRTDRDHIKDERDEHRGRVQAADPFARALEVDVIGVPRERGRQHTQESHADRPRRRDGLARQVENGGDDQCADRDVGDHRMHGMAEPRPVQQVAQAGERTVHRAEDALEDVAERVGPDGLRIQQRLEPATPG